MVGQPLNVDRLDLDSGGNISATTASRFGGNVEINVGDSLQLRNSSQINVEARSDRGDGGNLTINADTVVALENSDIIANAVGSNGGNINIAIYVRTKQEDAARNLSPKIEVEIQKIPRSREAVSARINWADSRRKLAADGKKLADLEIVKLLEVAVKKARELSDERGEAIALQQLALLYQKMGELITAQRFLEKSLLLAEGLGAEEIGARSPVQLGNVLKQQGKTEEETFILAWNEKINVTEFEQLLRTRSPRESTPIELLIPSACQTARGDERAALGLAGIAVRSGARSTLATLWSVQDNSTAEFMVEFYRQLTKPNISKAEALRRARIARL